MLPESHLKNQLTCTSERASEPHERSAPAPFDFAQGVVSVSRITERCARERVGPSEGRSPSGKTSE